MSEVTVREPHPFDLTGSLRDAGELAGVPHHTVARYVEARGRDVGGSAGREASVDRWVLAQARGVDRTLPWELRADKAHEKLLLLLGFTGSDRTTRRAVEAVKRNYGCTGRG